jgi:hypothetical protein
MTSGLSDVTFSRYLDLTDRTYPLLKLHQQFVHLMKTGSTVGFDLRSNFPQLVFLCAASPDPRQPEHEQGIPIRIELYKPIRLVELARLTCPTRTYMDRITLRDVPLRPTPTYFVNDLATLVIHEGGSLIPSPEFYKFPEVEPSDHCDERIQVVIDDGVSGAQLASTLAVVFDLVSSAGTPDERYQHFRQQYNAREYTFHLSCYPPAFESFVETVRPSHCDLAGICV